MLATLQHIVQLVNDAANLDEALAVVVREVKAAMGVDVCSVYIKDAIAGENVLRASDGLNPRSIGRVRLSLGEGLVGLVATRQEPVNLDNAADHPAYRYFPETGEERYRGFLGVPLVHFRKVVGVLYVLRHTQQRFAEDEVAFLVTIAAQLAGTLNAAVRENPANGFAVDPALNSGFHQGLAAAPGIAIGTIVLPSPFASLESVTDREPKDITVEEAAFREAVRAVQAELRRDAELMATRLPSEARAIFDVYEMMLGGDSLVENAIARIRAGNWAPGALRHTVDEHARVFDQMEDAYLKARGEDIRAIGRRLLAHLQSDLREPREYPAQTVLLGDEVSLARITDVPESRLAGIVCLRGSVLSHIAIIAKALGVPAVMGLGHLPVGDLDGRRIVLDGYQGRVFIDPPPAVVGEFSRLIGAERELSSELRKFRDLTAETPDGTRITLNVNIGLLAEAGVLNATGADGVGLYRTEFPFMVRHSFPGEDDQYQIYRDILQSFAPQPVTLRTLDVGGDKALPYYPMKEDNPYLGWRGIRFTLDHPEIFLPQLRAMLRANTGLGNLRIMFPMISQVGELREAQALLRQAHAELVDEGCRCSLPPVGVLIEVPAAVYQATALAAQADFLSIGSNDLTQYMLAVDRGNPNVARLYDSLHPAVLRALREVARVGRRYGKPVSVCGEMAGDPAAVILLLGMGIDTLSMSAGSLLRIKWVVRTFTAEHARSVHRRTLRLDNSANIRQLLNSELDQAGLGGLIRAGK
jgi:phosphotransferase system enzyme I (PtsP)